MYIQTMRNIIWIYKYKILFEDKRKQYNCDRRRGHDLKVLKHAYNETFFY